MKLTAYSRKKRGIAFISLLMSILCMACASHTVSRTSEDKNITDYFNILSRQKIVTERIIREKGEYKIRMEGCNELISAKIDCRNELIQYSYTNPCAGPPPVFIVAVRMATSGDTARFMLIWSLEQTWRQESTGYYRLNGTEFMRVEKKDLPADVAAKFNRYGR